MGKTVDEILSVGSDILGFVPGFQWAPLVGNSLSGADEISRGDFLTPALSILGYGAGQLGGNLAGAAAGAPSAEGLDLASQVTGQTPGFLAQHALGAGTSALASGIGSAVGNAGTQALLEPGLAAALGLNQGGPGTPQPQTTVKAPVAPTSGGGGAGPGAGPGGLDISGGTAPQIYPYVKGGQPEQSTSTPSSAAPTGGAAQPRQI